MAQVFTFWAWFIVALVLAGIEMFMPGAFMIWLGLAAAATGLVTWVLDLGWEAQLAVFAVLAIVSVLAGRQIVRKAPAGGDDSLSRRGSRTLGRLVTLVEPIVNGRGRAQLDDSVWEVRGPDAPAGTTMRVVGTEGATLLVEAAAGAQGGGDAGWQ